MDTISIIAVALLALSEVLALIPKIKSNSIFTLLVNILKKVAGKTNMFFLLFAFGALFALYYFLECGQGDGFIILSGFTIAGFTENVALGTSS
jgi:hypothetical protein